jgi:HNH endonuclease
MHPDVFSERFCPEPMSGCWLWIRHRNASGYGTVKAFGTKSMLAHRASWMIHVGSIPEGMCVLHRCDTPACVNPEHLWLGTHLENMRDMDRKGRCFRGHAQKLSSEHVREIMSLKGSGLSQEKIGKLYGVSQVMVSRIWLGKSWSRRVRVESTPKGTRKR